MPQLLMILGLILIIGSGVAAYGTTRRLGVGIDSETYKCAAPDCGRARTDSTFIGYCRDLQSNDALELIQIEAAFRENRERVSGAEKRRRKLQKRATNGAIVHGANQIGSQDAGIVELAVSPEVGSLLVRHEDRSGARTYGTLRGNY